MTAKTQKKVRLHIRKSDQVVVITGADKGKRGRVLRVIPKRQRVVVEGVRYVTKHQRGTAQSPERGRIQKEAPIDASNVLLHCPKCDRGVRISHRKTSDGSKVRVCKKCGEEISAAT